MEVLNQKNDSVRHVGLVRTHFDLEYDKVIGMIVKMINNPIPWLLKK